MITTEPVQQVELRAMGGRAHVVVHGGPPDALELAARRLRDLEARWSRFREDSDVTRANRAAGRPVEVDDDTLAVVAHALIGERQTGGRFTIGVLPALLAAGYTHSVVDQQAAPELPRGQGGGRPVGPVATVDYEARTVCVASGTAIDLGGIGKGFAADLVAEDLLDAGASGALVNVGGDLRVAGSPIDADAWRVGILDPRPDTTGHAACVRLAAGGVATSGTTVRRWTLADGSTAHHVIDPAIGSPAVTRVVTATVLARDAAAAEVIATAMMLVEPAVAIAELDRWGLAGLLVDLDGTVHRSRCLAGFEEEVGE